MFIMISAATLVACGGGHNNTENMADKVESLVQCARDSTKVFEDYEALFVEVLDSLEDIVNNHPNADYRFLARKLVVPISEVVYSAQPQEKRDSIFNLYNSRCNVINTTWYVQQLLDTTTNSPFVIMSYAAPYDEDMNDTRVSFTFSESNEPIAEPCMIIHSHDVGTYPVVLFSLWTNDMTHIVTYKADKDMTAITDSTGVSLLLFGDFLQDMLKYEEMKVCYWCRSPFYPRTHKPSISSTIRIPVDIHQFQKQYESVHKWLIEYSKDSL